ncbi:MAG: sigma-70 family RNA polymerase sigma factor [Acidimicrobiia bacterium]
MNLLVAASDGSRRAVRDVNHLAAAARDGDRVALEQFVAATQGDVWTFCARMMGRHQADDLTQETFLRAIGTLRTFRGESSALTWLLIVARNTCVDTIRRETRRRRIRDRLARYGETGQDPVQPEQSVELEELIERLSPDRRLAFVLTQTLGLSYDEAAEVCEVPIGTIRSRVARARQDLMAMLDDDSGGITGVL